MGTRVNLKNVQICYPHLYTPRKAPGADKAKWSVECILDPSTPDGVENLKALEAAFMAELVGAGKDTFAAQIPRPFKTGEEVNVVRAQKGKDPRKEVLGKYVIRASTGQSAPVVIDRNMNPILNETEIFGGCICNVAIDLYWFVTKENAGVFTGLNGVQLLSNTNVERIGGGAPTAEDLFQKQAPDPTQQQQAPVADYQRSGQSAVDVPDWMG